MKMQKILIIDDSEMNRTILIDMLGYKYEIEEAEDAASAVSILEKRAEEFSVVLLDIVMPGGSGFDVLAYLNDNHLLDHMAVIMISADDSVDNIKKAYGLGAFDYISRPFDIDVVRHRVANTMLLYKKQHQLEDLVAEQIQKHQKDNELNWEVAREILSDLNLELDWAENGQICVEKFENSEEGYYDAVLMDLRMPVMNGYDATKAIRALNRSDAAKIPIIAMTADAFTEDIKRCLETGMNAHTAKPININELARLLKKYIFENR